MRAACHGGDHSVKLLTDGLVCSQIKDKAVNDSLSRLSSGACLPTQMVVLQKIVEDRKSLLLSLIYSATPQI